MKKNILKSIMYFSLLALLIVPIVNVNAENLVTSIEVSEETINLNVGGNKTITPTVLPADADDLSVTYTSSNPNVATVDENGKVVGVAAGNAEITITSVNASSVTKKVAVNVQQAKSGDFNLKSLEVVGYKISPSFTASNKAYTLTVPANITKVTIKAETNDSTASVAGTGSFSLAASGDSTAKITVTAEDGGKKTYTVKITKEETNLDLKTLKVKGQTLNQTFSADVTDYTMDVEYAIERLSITAAASDSTAKVTVNNGKAINLVVGENKIVVTVKDTYGNTKNYNIVVTRKDEEEEENTNSTSTVTSVAPVIDTSSNTKNHTLQYVLVTIGCILLLAIAGFGIYFFVKTEDPAKKKAKLEKKLAKKNLKVKEDKIESALVEAEVAKVEEEIEDSEEQDDSEEESDYTDEDYEEYDEENDEVVEDINDQDTIEFERPRPSRRMSRYSDEEDE